MNGKQLFIFDKAGYDLPEVDEWLSGDPPELYETARKWFAVFRQCGDDVLEIMHDGMPTACVQTAAFGYVNVFKSHVNVGFFTGAFLDDPHDLLEGSGKRMRHVKVGPAIEVNEQALRDLIKAAYHDVSSRLGNG